MSGRLDRRPGRRARGEEPVAREVYDPAVAGVLAAVAQEERRQLSWSRVEDPGGQQVVATSLDILTRYGWTALHGAHWRGAPDRTFAHIAIGPGGIVVIEERDWTGSVVVEAGVLRHGGYRCDEDVEALTGATGAITALLPAVHRSAVVGVICVASRDLEPAQAAGIHVVGRLHLASLLVGMAPRLSPLDVADITRELSRMLTGPVAGPVGAGDGAVFLPSSAAPPVPTVPRPAAPVEQIGDGRWDPRPTGGGRRGAPGEPVPYPAPSSVPVEPSAYFRPRPLVLHPELAAQVESAAAPTRRQHRLFGLRGDVVGLVLALGAAALVAQNNEEITVTVSDWLDPVVAVEEPQL